MHRTALQLVLHASDEVAAEARQRLDVILQSDADALIDALRRELVHGDARHQAVAAAALASLDDADTRDMRRETVISLIRSDELIAIHAGLRAARLDPTDEVIAEAMQHRGHASPELRDASLRVLAAAGREEDIGLGIAALVGDDDAARDAARELLERFDNDIVCDELADQMLGAEPRGWAAGARHLAERGANHVVMRQIAPRLEAFASACEVCATLPRTHDPAIRLVRRQAESLAQTHLLGVLFAMSSTDALDVLPRHVRRGVRHQGDAEARGAILDTLEPDDRASIGTGFELLDVDHDMVIGWRSRLNEAAERVGDPWLSYGVDAIVDVARSSGAFRDLGHLEGDESILADMGVMLMDESTSTLYQRILTLSECSIFNGLDLDELAWIARVVTDRYFTDGERIIARDEDGEEMYIVVTGALEVLPEGVTAGSPGAIRLGEGAVVGEMALVASLPRSADVVSAGDSHVLALARHEFTDCLLTHSSIALGLLNVLAERLAAANRAL